MAQIKHYSTLLMALTVLVMLISGCSEYNSVIKKGTSAEKLAMAKKMYEKEDYFRALPLLEELMGSYTGRAEREEIYYMFSMSNYNVEEYNIASYHFKNLSETYSSGKYAEEAAFMHAACFVESSLSHELDQSDTKVAIDRLQLFINEHPNSSYLAQSNAKIDELRKKLLYKTYLNAKLWFNIGDYKAAAVSCKNAVYDYPDIEQKEELEYLVVEALYRYAKNSVLSTQVERYQEVIEEANSFLKIYKEQDEYYPKVLKINKKTTEELTEVKAQLASPN